VRRSGLEGDHRPPLAQLGLQAPGCAQHGIRNRHRRRWLNHWPTCSNEAHDPHSARLAPGWRPAGALLAAIPAGVAAGLAGRGVRNDLSGGHAMTADLRNWATDPGARVRPWSVSGRRRGGGSGRARGAAELRQCSMGGEPPAVLGAGVVIGKARQQGGRRWCLQPLQPSAQ